MKKSQHLLSLLALFVTLAGLGANSAAAPYPEKAVKVVVGYGPGSSTDIIGRILAQGLSDLWRQAVVVENRPGAAGTIAADMVAKSPADG